MMFWLLFAAGFCLSAYVLHLIFGRFVAPFLCVLLSLSLSAHAIAPGVSNDGAYAVISYGAWLTSGEGIGGSGTSYSWGQPNTIFLNSSNKQTYGLIVVPLIKFDGYWAGSVPMYRRGGSSPYHIVDSANLRIRYSEGDMFVTVTTPESQEYSVFLAGYYSGGSTSLSGADNQGAIPPVTSGGVPPGSPIFAFSDPVGSGPAYESPALLGKEPTSYISSGSTYNSIALVGLGNISGPTTNPTTQPSTQPFVDDILEGDGPQNGLFDDLRKRIFGFEDEEENLDEDQGLMEWLTDPGAELGGGGEEPIKPTTPLPAEMQWMVSVVEWDALTIPTSPDAVANRIETVAEFFNDGDDLLTPSNNQFNFIAAMDGWKPVFRECVYAYTQMKVDYPQMFIVFRTIGTFVVMWAAFVGVLRGICRVFGYDDYGLMRWMGFGVVVDELQSPHWMTQPTGPTDRTPERTRANSFMQYRFAQFRTGRPRM